MPRKRSLDAPRVVYRTARCGLRATRGQRRRLVGLLRSAGDVWCCVLEVNAWRRRRQDVPLAGYRELCRELAVAGPGTFAELDSSGARSVLRRYSDAWLATVGRRRAGGVPTRFPRRRRGLVPVRWYAGRFTLQGRRLGLPVARGCQPLVVRLDRDLPYPAGQVRSVTLLVDAGRLWVDVTAEVPVAAYPDGQQPDPARVAGWTWGSFIRTPWPGRAGMGCWCPGGRSAPSAASTCARPGTVAAPRPAGRRAAGSGARGGGGSIAAVTGWRRRGMGGGCGRPSTRPPQP
jgi:hypothetical protein